MFSGYNDTSFIIHPPKTIQKSYYRCDNRFHLDAVSEMYGESIAYGIVLLSGKEYRCYILEIIGSHKEFILVNSDEIQLQKRQKKGGQSAVRFDRIREIQRNHYTREVAEVIRQTYMRKNDTECIIKGLIVGGVAGIKKEIMDEEIFQQYFSQKVMRVVNTEVINDLTVYDVYNKSCDLLSKLDMKAVSQIIDEIKNLIIDADDTLVFGIDEIVEGIGNYSIKKVIISENIIDNYNYLTKNKLYDYEIHIVPDNLINEYGGIIAIKYYND